MEKLDKIQTKENLNEVYAAGEKGPGGAYHVYSVNSYGEQEAISWIEFQKGPRNAEGSISGVLEPDLLEIVRHRLECFQQGEFACDYNEKALYHIKAALRLMNKRIEDRIQRNVLGKYEK